MPTSSSTTSAGGKRDAQNGRRRGLSAPAVISTGLITREPSSKLTMTCSNGRGLHELGSFKSYVSVKVRSLCVVDMKRTGNCYGTGMEAWEVSTTIH